MPIFKTGDMWTAFDEATLFLLTTNATIKRNGALVMGRGIARQARDRFPGLDAALGKQILSVCGNPSALLRPGAVRPACQPALARSEVGCVPGKATLQPAGQFRTYPA
jgi:hypothetical protein